ncbi:MAG: DEAD/DEAH box helicase [Candidatus Moraniibacteriota bacterium]
MLARQHYATLERILEPLGEAPALFTASFRILDGKSVSRKTLLGAIEAGIPRIIVGTHALIQPDVRFQDLGLVIVDEQHRFGVAQRAALQEAAFRSRDGEAKGKNERVPHFLTMTATPIPRTLALAFFGNLDISVLDEMPQNRLPIKTRVAKSETDKREVFRFIDREIESGRQAFIIFPLVEESLALKDVKAATVEHARLAESVFRTGAWAWYTGV